eukprot:SM000006S19322  [mRNA]  locus=s6:22642:24430:+ [translate_table: standard]
MEGDRSSKRIARERTPIQFANPLLRFLQLASAAVAFAIMLASSSHGTKWHAWQAFQYLMIGSVIVAAWALLMLLVDLGLCCIGINVHSLAFKMLVALGDFVGKPHLLATCLALSAGSAAAGITMLNDCRLLGKPNICSGSHTQWNSLCVRSKAATAFALIAFFFFLPSLIASIREVAKVCYLRKLCLLWCVLEYYVEDADHERGTYA